MQPFAYVGQPSRAVFGSGSAETLGAEIAALGCRRALLCCTPGRAATVDAFAGRAEAPVIGICARAEPFTPLACAEEGRGLARTLGADCLVSYGGGNAVGLAKAIALDLGLPIVALPTTYSGSETTAQQGIRGPGGRVSYDTPRIRPKTIIYDAALSVDLPVSVSIPSGIHAISHAVGSISGHGGNPIAALLAEEGIRAMAAALPRIAADPADIDARGEALYGAFLCGSALTVSGMVIHHKIVHVLAGDFGLSHAETHSILTPHSTAYNRGAVPEAMRRIARALGDESRDAPGLLFDLLVASGAPTALCDIGMKRDDIDRAAALIMTKPYDNPRAYEPDAIAALIDDAWHGRRPRA